MGKLCLAFITKPPRGCHDIVGAKVPLETVKYCPDVGKF